ncbi:extracellular solute-binding protein [Pantoea sp. 1.19]|uniref:extracellular solute-binding protein n=1 Tax=Pantoea sp. 1.19 TaxID=1925589 RepID=UPI000948D83B|nr:extracellular solute-binding protein [Pantoea sp. 1.19]
MKARFIFLLFLLMGQAHGETVREGTAFAQLGTPKYAPGFTHFDYVNPAAPKGGSIVLSAIGTWDSFNRFASRGVPGAATDTLYDSLFTGAEDEVGSYYPLIAESARYRDDFRWMEVRINPQARFHDGSPITASDVAFTFGLFMREGVPQFRVFYKGVTVTAIDRLTVRIALPQANKDMLLGLLTLPVMPESFWKDHRLDAPLSAPPPGSGPYRITAWKPGQSITYSRVTDYWAAALPVNRGRYNFDTMRYDYYLDDNVAFEAFKAGAFDLRSEGSAKKWATQYRGKAFDAGYIVKDAQPNTVTTDTRWLAFNVEKPLFQDRRVREALAQVFDFNWMNRVLFYQAYKQPDSYFQNTRYAARGLPDAAERALLEPFKDRLPPALFHAPFTLPHSDGSGYDRQNLLRATALLGQAGWVVKNQRLVHATTGQPFRFELLLMSGAASEWVLPYQHNLRRLGIEMQLRQVDSSQYLKRLRSGDYDMIPTPYQATPFPSADLPIRWQSQYIDSSYNRPRVKSPVLDALLDQIVARQDDEQALLPLGRALDRVLLWNHYQIPMWYNADERTAWWNKFSRPAERPRYALGLSSWWYDAGKAATLPAQRR